MKQHLLWKDREDFNKLGEEPHLSIVAVLGEKLSSMQGKNSEGNIKSAFVCHRYGKLSKIYYTVCPMLCGTDWISITNFIYNTVSADNALTFTISLKMLVIRYISKSENCLRGPLLYHIIVFDVCGIIVRTRKRKLDSHVTWISLFLFIAIPLNMMPIYRRQ